MREILILLLLSGCAQTPVVYKPVTVSVPVAVPCRAPEISPPVWPLQTIDPAASLFEKVRAALVEIELRKAYEEQLGAAVRACQ